VVLDGAHNPAGAAALRQAIEESFAGIAPRILLYGALAGRDPVEFLEQAGVRAMDLVVTTEPRSPRALPAMALAEAARSFGVPATAVSHPGRALAAAVTAAGSHGVVIATGSLHLIGPLRAAASTPPPVVKS
jgi:dihydrofolate synthase/folylpolyglutamate synthase